MLQLKNVFGLLLLVAMFSCRKEPPSDPIPEISYLRYEQHSLREPGVIGDSISLTIRFKDGDGDLGLNATEPENVDSHYPYSFLKPDGSINPFRNNYFVNTLVKENGRFVPLEFPLATYTYSGRFLRLSHDDRIEPLEGELTYLLPDITPMPNVPQLKPGAIIKFEIQIADRALNLSNIVETEEITLRFEGK